MGKEDKLSPVISVVVYWGEKEWDGAKNLHGMLDISEEMLPFVNDYKMLLVEARENRLNLHNINNVDLFNLLEILQDRSCTLNETKKKAIDYAKEHKVEKSVIMAVAGVTDHTIDYDALEKKGVLDMYTVVKEIREEGRAEEIIDFGYECGISEEDILQRLQKRLNISLQKAQEYLQAYGKQMV